MTTRSHLAFNALLLTLAIMVTLCLPASVNAQFTHQLTYQGVLKDNTGALVNGTQNITFRICTTPTGGLGVGSIWSSTSLSIPVKNGLFSVVLGPLPDPPVDFSQDYWLEIEYPTTVQILPRTPLTPAPYAMRAAIADALATGIPLPLWEMNSGNARLIAPNTTAPVLIGAGTAPTTPGRLNVAGNTADNATLRIVPPSSATTPQTILLSDGVNTSSGAATGISLGTIQTATGGPSTGMYIDNVITGGGGPMAFGFRTLHRLRQMLGGFG